MRVVVMLMVVVMIMRMIVLPMIMIVAVTLMVVTMRGMGRGGLGGLTCVEAAPQTHGVTLTRAPTLSRTKQER